jgi:hypothetical protein
MDSLYEIYRLISPSGKSYIGQAKYERKNRTRKGGDRRWHEHQNDAKRGRKTALCNAIRKHGASSFKMEILLQCHQRDVDMHEKMMMTVC